MDIPTAKKHFENAEFYAANAGEATETSLDSVAGSNQYHQAERQRALWLEQARAHTELGRLAVAIAAADSENSEGQR